jgi:hypothetical protein
VTPLLFDSEQEAVEFLSQRGFTITWYKDIAWTGKRLGSHREIYAVDWLCRKFDYQYIGQLTANKS